MRRVVALAAYANALWPRLAARASRFWSAAPRERPVVADPWQPVVRQPVACNQVAEIWGLRKSGGCGSEVSGGCGPVVRLGCGNLGRVAALLISPSPRAFGLAPP